MGQYILRNKIPVHGREQLLHQQRKELSPDPTFIDTLLSLEVDLWHLWPKKTFNGIFNWLPDYDSFINVEPMRSSLSTFKMRCDDNSPLLIISMGFYMIWRWNRCTLNYCSTLDSNDRILFYTPCKHDHGTLNCVDRIHDQRQNVHSYSRRFWLTCARNYRYSSWWP